MARRGAKLGTSVLDLDVDDSRFHSKLGRAHVAAQKWTDQTGTDLMKAGKAISGVGEAWTRNVTVPILAAGGASAKVALDFDTTFRQIVGLTDVTGDQVDGLKEKVLALGPAVGKGPRELGEALYFIVSAGFDADEAMDVLETSAKAAAAGLGQTQTVAQVLGSVINAYGKENLKAADAAGILTEAVSQGTAEADAFAGVVGRVVPSAANLGVSFDQVTAALAGMTLTGLSAEEAAVGLNQVFISLLKPTAEAEAAMTGMGLSAAGLRQQLREQGLLATLRTLEERFGGNEEASAKVFGNVRALRTVTALLGLETDQLNTIFEKTASSGASRLAAAYEATEGPGREMARSMARLEATAIRFGDNVLPLVVQVLDEVANHAENLGEWWAALDDGTRELIVRMLALVAVAGPFLIIFGKMATGAGALLKTIAFLGGSKGIPRLVGAFKLLGARSLLLLGPLGVLLGAFIAFEEPLKDFANDVMGISKHTQRLADQVDEPAKKVRWALLRLADDLDQSLGQVQDRVLAFMQETGASFDEAVDAVGRNEDKLRANLSRWNELYADGLNGVVDTLEGGADDIAAGAEAAFSGVDDEAAEARAAALAQMSGMLSQIAALFENDESLQQEFQALLERMDDPYTEAERKADIFSSDLIEIIRGGLKSGDPKLTDDTRILVNNLLSQFETLEPGALAHGEGVPPALQKGMDSQMRGLIEWIEGTLIHQSLLALTLEEAEELGLGGIYLYAQGMRRNLAVAGLAAQAVRQEASRELSALKGDAWTSGFTAGGTYGSGIRSPVNIRGVGSAGRALASEATEGVNVNLWQVGYNVGKSYGDGLAWAGDNYIVDVAGDIRRSVGGHLQFAGSPPYTKSKEYGTGVGLSWIDSVIAAVMHETPQLGQALEQALAPHGMLIPSMATPLGPDVAAMDEAGAFGAVGGQVTEIHYHYELSVDGKKKESDNRIEFMRDLDAMAKLTDARIAGR